VGATRLRELIRVALREDARRSNHDIADLLTEQSEKVSRRLTTLVQEVRQELEQQGEIAVYKSRTRPDTVTETVRRRGTPELELPLGSSCPCAWHNTQAICCANTAPVYRTLQSRDGGDDLAPEDVERRDLVDVAHVEDGLLDAGVG
jgi:hypothetical protein